MPDFLIFAASGLVFDSWAWTGTIVVVVLQWGLVPHLLAQRNKSPNATLAWLWAILLFPVLGGVAYFLMGSERVYRRRLRLVRDLVAKVGPRGAPVPCRFLCQVPELALINGFPSTGGNEAELLIDGTAFFRRCFKPSPRPGTTSIWNSTFGAWTGLAKSSVMPSLPLRHGA